jgi:hypothetical protein
VPRAGFEAALQSLDAVLGGAQGQSPLAAVTIRLGFLIYSVASGGPAFRGLRQKHLVAHPVIGGD